MSGEKAPEKPPAVSVGSDVWLGVALASMKKAERDYLCCSDFREIKDAPGCCTSCHDDWDEGYDSPDIYEADEKLPVPSSLCCRLRSWVNEQTPNVKISHDRDRKI